MEGEERDLMDIEISFSPPHLYRKKFYRSAYSTTKYYRTKYVDNEI